MLTPFAEWKHHRWTELLQEERVFPLRGSRGVRYLLLVSVLHDGCCPGADSLVALQYHQRDGWHFAAETV